METILIVIKFIANHFQDILTAIVGILTGLIGLFMIIPGEQPEKTLRLIASYIEKFSKK